MRQRWLIIALVFSGMINVAAIGTIGYHWWRVDGEAPPSPRFPPEEMPAPLRRELNLSSAQAQKLTEHRRQTSEEMQKIRRDLLETRTRMMQLLRSPNPDSMAVEEILQKMVSSQVALERKVIHSILGMREVLTPEQRERLLRMMEKRFRWEGKGPGPEHGMRRRPFDPGRRKGGR